MFNQLARFSELLPELLVSIANMVCGWRTGGYWSILSVLATTAPGTYSQQVVFLGGVYNSSTTPRSLPWDTYNYCNAPHVNARHYTAPEDAELVHLSVMMRHHKVRSSQRQAQWLMALSRELPTTLFSTSAILTLLWAGTAATSSKSIMPTRSFLRRSHTTHSSRSPILLLLIYGEETATLAS
jgi:hypothetical protein